MKNTEEKELENRLVNILKCPPYELEYFVQKTMNKEIAKLKEKIEDLENLLENHLYGL